MEFRALAIVELLFTNQVLPENDAAAVESLLRQDKNINNLSIHSDRMIFFLWAEKKIDYAMLDRVKEELQKRGNKNFTLTADEYSKTGQTYSYDARNAKK